MAYMLSVYGVPGEVSAECFKERFSPYGTIVHLHHYDGFRGSEILVIYSSQQEAEAAAAACENEDEHRNALYFPDVVAARARYREEYMAAHEGRANFCYAAMGANARSVLEYQASSDFCYALAW